MNRRIGFIGLGKIGNPIAKNLLHAGYSLTVHNRSPEPVNELVSLGAESAKFPKGIAEVSDMIFTCLPSAEDLTQVVFGEHGITEGCHPGMILIDTSTIHPAIARQVACEMEKLDVFFLDAPVSGGVKGAEKGALSMMVGGPQTAFEAVLPILETIAEKITFIGCAGAGQLAKACNQILASAQLVAIAEVLIFAQKTGVDPRVVVDALRGGAARCWLLESKAEKLFRGDREPGFKASLMHKDLSIVLDTARTYGIPLPATALHAQLFNAMLQMGMKDQDCSAVIGVLEYLSGEHLQDDEHT